MPAVNEKDLKKTPATLCIAPIPTGFEKLELLDDGSNAKAVFDAVIAAVVADNGWTRL